MFNLVYRTRRALKDIDDIINVIIIQEEQSGHFHLWFFPRYKWMNETFDNSLSTIREIMRYARTERKTEENIIEILSTVKLLKDMIQTMDINTIVHTNIMKTKY